LCREEAIDVCQRFNKIVARNQALSNVPLVAVVKEVGEENLGIGEFQMKYFDGRPVYLDEAKIFYDFLGNRRLSISFGSLLNPVKLYRDFKALQGRLREKNVEGNFAGEGLIQGGLIVFGPGKGDNVLYTYKEITGSEIPLDGFEEGLLKLLVCK